MKKNEMKIKANNNQKRNNLLYDNQTGSILLIAKEFAIKKKKPIAFFSLEMSSVQLVSRLIMMESQLIGNKKNQSRKFISHKWRQFEKNMELIEKASIFVFDMPTISLVEAHKKIIRLKKQHNVELIIIDSLQLITAGAKENTSKKLVEKIVLNSLETLSKDLKVPIVIREKGERNIIFDPSITTILDPEKENVKQLLFEEDYKTQEAMPNSSLSIDEVLLCL